ncbi:MAG: hypothetical protein ACXWMH_08240 [Syntrophales bacterium]
MKSYLKYGIALCAIFAFLFFVGLEITLAQQTLTYVGSVAGIDIGAFSRGTITVKGNNGAFMIFAVGRNTIYNPARQPGVGERVKITYSFIRGDNVAYQVEIVATPAAPPPPRPEEYLMVTGKVVGMHNYQLTVKDDKKQTIYFSTGKSTVFIPAREPHVDEKVKVTYYVRKGDNVATQVEILSANK